MFVIRSCYSGELTAGKGGGRQTSMQGEGIA